jgi:glucosamine--fructose-6-phosphate aminotransferase (isomerizing)
VAVGSHEPYLPAEILQQGSVVERVLAMEPQIATVAAAIHARGIRDVIMTGCGDSLFAAMAAQFGFVAFSRSLTHAMHALEYSRAFYRSSNETTLVCALSYGGETRRTLEAVIGAKHVGAQVLAVSVDERGPIPQHADYFLPNAAPVERSNCRTGSFQAAYLELVLLAAHLAHQRGDLGDDDLASLRSELASLASTLAAFAPAVRAEAEKVGQMLASAGQVYYLGGGEAFAVALYGAAKLYETSSVPAIPQESEQFAHCEIFSLETDSVVILTALSGSFYQRAVEVADAVRTIGARVIAVTDDPGFASHADQIVEIPRVEPGRLMASLAVVPLQWIAYGDARQRGSDPDLVRHKAVNSPLIRQSPIWSEQDYRHGNGNGNGNGDGGAS